MKIQESLKAISSLANDLDQAGASLAECFQRLKANKPSNPWLSRIQVDASDSSRNPASTKINVRTSPVSRADNHQMTLRKIACELEPALELFQRKYGGGKAKIRLQVIESEKTVEFNNPTVSTGKFRSFNSQEFKPYRERLLTKGELKTLKREIKTELDKVGIKPPVITLYTLRLYDEIYNLAIVRGDFSPRHYETLRKIHEAYRPRDGALKGLSNSDSKRFFLDVRFATALPAIIQAEPVAKGRLLRLGPEHHTAHAEMEKLLLANSRRIEDRRSETMIAVDSVRTQRPEDIFNVQHHKDGSCSILLSVPSVLSDKKYYKPGVECLSMGIETKILKSGEVEMGGLRLMVSKQDHWLSTREVDGAIQAGAFHSRLARQKFMGEMGEGAFEEFAKLYRAAQLAAKGHLRAGNVLKDAVQEGKLNRGTRISLTGSEMINELIKVNQMALARSLAEKKIPVLVLRAGFNFGRFKSDFRAVLGEQADDCLNKLYTPAREEVLAALEAGGHHELLDKIGRYLVKAQTKGKPKFHVVSNLDELEALDTAPFKPGHAAVAWKINQLQVAAGELNKKVFTCDQMQRFAAKINKGANNGDYRVLESLPWIEDKFEQLRDALYSTIAPD